MARIKTRKPRGSIRTLDPSDPRNPNHPCHDGQWDELAEAIGRMLARQDYAQSQRGNDNGDEDGGGLR
jgi:hypothetical protein